MTAAKRRVRLAVDADRDFQNILAHTKEIYGARQQRIYGAALRLAISSLRRGPCMVDSLARDDIMPDYRMLHIGRRGRPGRHFIVYREEPDHPIVVIRVLYDGIDLSRHITPDIR